VYRIASYHQAHSMRKVLIYKLHTPVCPERLSQIMSGVPRCFLRRDHVYSSEKGPSKQSYNAIPSSMVVVTLYGFKGVMQMPYSHVFAFEITYMQVVPSISPQYPQSTKNRPPFCIVQPQTYSWGTERHSSCLSGFAFLPAPPPSCLPISFLTRQTHVQSA